MNNAEPKISDILKLLEGATWRVDRYDTATLVTTVGPYEFKVRDFGIDYTYTQLSIYEVEKEADWLTSGTLLYILGGKEISELYDKVSDKYKTTSLDSLRNNFNNFLQTQLEKKV